MKTWIKRALRTFVQTAVGYLVVAVPAVDWSDSSHDDIVDFHGH